MQSEHFEVRIIEISILNIIKSVSFKDADLLLMLPNTNCYEHFGTVKHRRRC